MVYWNLTHRRQNLLGAKLNLFPSAALNFTERFFLKHYGCRRAPGEFSADCEADSEAILNNRWILDCFCLSPSEFKAGVKSNCDCVNYDTVFKKLYLMTVEEVAEHKEELGTCFLLDGYAMILFNKGIEGVVVKRLVHAKRAWWEEGTVELERECEMVKQEAWDWVEANVKWERPKFDDEGDDEFIRFLLQQCGYI